jgi:hypothetical protein
MVVRGVRLLPKNRRGSDEVDSGGTVPGKDY